MHLRRRFEVGRDASVIHDMNAASLERLSEADLELIEAVAGESLALHGYARPGVAIKA